MTWGLVLWGANFFGETHKWVVARIAETWVIAGSAVGYVVVADLGVQILVAVVYIAVGVWLAFHAEPIGRPAVVWYDRAAIAVLWLPAFAFVLGLTVAIMAYMVGLVIAFYAGAFGLVFLPYEAGIRGILALLGR